jgi:ribosomal protein S18 acetylase RimI-like enzyme
MVNIRPMTEDDLDAVMVIQSSAYYQFFQEERFVFEDRLHNFPDGCWIAEVDGCSAGYLFSHPCQLNAPPKLNSAIENLPEKPDCYFIHDVAVKPEFRSMGIGRSLADKAKQLAIEHNFKDMALISVQNSEKFWNNMGFKQVTSLSKEMAEKLESYKTESYPNSCLMMY